MTRTCRSEEGYTLAKSITVGDTCAFYYQSSKLELLPPIQTSKKRDIPTAEKLSYPIEQRKARYHMARCF